MIWPWQAYWQSILWCRWIWSRKKVALRKHYRSFNAVRVMLVCTHPTNRNIHGYERLIAVSIKITIHKLKLRSFQWAIAEEAETVGRNKSVRGKRLFALRVLLYWTAGNLWLASNTAPWGAFGLNGLRGDDEIFWLELAELGNDWNPGRWKTLAENELIRAWSAVCCWKFICWLKSSCVCWGVKGCCWLVNWGLIWWVGWSPIELFGCKWYPFGCCWGWKLLRGWGCDWKPLSWNCCGWEGYCIEAGLIIIWVFP